MTGGFFLQVVVSTDHIYTFKIHCAFPQMMLYYQTYQTIVSVCSSKYNK